ncbi:MAG: GntR family transcriptional regulator [Chloroflexota bacterium]|nr:GntR family transcriptional regulator [Chloroflexota bacterium]
MSSRVAVVADALRTAIARGDYLPGERLVELRIAAAHQVSQVTARDALRLLDKEGWVVSEPRRGATVRTFTTAQAEEVYALLAAIESQALRWVFSTLKKAARDELRGHVRAARRASLDSKTGLGLSILFEIHLTLARIASAEHPLTGELLDRLHNHARLLEAMRRSRSKLPSRELDPLIAGHDAFCERLDARDLDGAEALLRRQIVLYGALVLDVLRA